VRSRGRRKGLAGLESGVLRRKWRGWRPRHAIFARFRVARGAAVWFISYRQAGSATHLGNAGSSDGSPNTQAEDEIDKVHANRNIAFRRELRRIHGWDHRAQQRGRDPMADHVDGPRALADPASDVTDLFVFFSPENAKRTVLVANVFPFAGESALFSNVVNYSIAVRRAHVVAVGDAARFATEDAEIRFTFQFETLKPLSNGERPAQTGACKLPDGRTISLAVNDEKGASTPDKSFRAFAGLRSDPFFIGWLPQTPLLSLPNYVAEDNVLSLVVEFDTDAVLEPGKGSLFGAIFEAAPRVADAFRNNPPRFDWIGRPEVTNFLLNATISATDLRDVWNQQTPFAISPELLPVFRERLTRSLREWDIRDGKVDWTPGALAANVNVFLDDFLLFDVAKPIDDTSHLEIEKSTVLGRAYQTGGGRTLDANAVDILVTWLINQDRGPFQQSGATGATQPAGKSFPYVRPPNTRVLTVSQTARLSASPDLVWAAIGQFDSLWHPLVATSQITGSGTGQLRRIKTVDGQTIVERLEDIDNARRILRYTMVSGIPAAHYEGILEVQPRDAGSAVTWRVNYRLEGQPDLIVRTIISTLLRTGLDSLKLRFGSPP